MTAFLILLAAVAVLGRDDTRDRIISVLDEALPEKTGAERDELAERIVEALRRGKRGRK